MKNEMHQWTNYNNYKNNCVMIMVQPGFKSDAYSHKLLYGFKTKSMESALRFICSIGKNDTVYNYFGGIKAGYTIAYRDLFIKIKANECFNDGKLYKEETLIKIIKRNEDSRDTVYIEREDLK